MNLLVNPELEGEFIARALTYTPPAEGSSTAVFTFDDRPDVVRVAMTGDELQFVLHRSSVQRELLAKLGRLP